MDGHTRLLYCYAPQDESHREALDKQLAGLQRSGVLTTWSAQRMLGGDEVEAEFARQLALADIVLLLLSADFVASEVCHARLEGARAEAARRELRLVPVLVRPALLSGPLAGLAPLPADRVPITAAQDPEAAWLAVAQGIQALVPGAQAAGAEPAPLAAAPGRRRQAALALVGVTVAGLALAGIGHLRRQVPAPASVDHSAGPIVRPISPQDASPAGPGPAASAVNSDNLIEDSPGARMRNAGGAPAGASPVRRNSGNVIRGSAGARMTNEVGGTP